MPKARKSNLAAPLGAVVLVLALVGAVFLLSAAWKTAASILDNSGKKKELEQLVLPVLMFDPIPFDSVETADPITLLQSSIWAVVLNDTSGKYTIELGESLTISETDVEAAATRLFGPDVKLTHQTFGEMDQNYYYSENNHTYYVPLYTQVGYYIPRVTKIEKEADDVYSLTVGYVAPNNGVLVAMDTETREPDKYMIYDVKYNREKKQYYILALRDMPRENAVDSSSSASQAE